MDITGHNLQILINHCVAAADAMAYTIVRTAHSTFVKETEDFTCTILDVNGQAIASIVSYPAKYLDRTLLPIDLQKLHHECITCALHQIKRRNRFIFDCRLIHRFQLFCR